MFGQSQNVNNLQRRVAYPIDNGNVDMSTNDY